MKLLIKFPTRGRPTKSVETLKKYIQLASFLDNIKVIVSIDEDDTTLNKSMFESIHPCIECIAGKSCGKIGAINRDIPDPSTFDIILLASDDMIPQVKGYDAIIRSQMTTHFPDTDGVLFFNDGYAKYNLNTLVICGSKYYQRFEYLYNPEYKSFYCDNEFMDVAFRLGRQVYIHDVIIRHEHPVNTSSATNDSLYEKNQVDWNTDSNLYHNRKFKNYDLSVLVCTIPSRIGKFVELLNCLTKLKQTTSLAVEVLYDDDMSITIGEKRNRLVNKCFGKYCSFVDDDDKVTEDYYKVVEESGLTYDSITLNGMRYSDGIKDMPFYNSIKYDRWSQDSNGYYRHTNHLNPIKTSIVKQIRFPSANYGEDGDFSTRLLKSGLLNTQYMHDKLQYLYMHSSKDNSYPENFNKFTVKQTLNKLFKLKQ